MRSRQGFRIYDPNLILFELRSKPYIDFVLACSIFYVRHDKTPSESLFLATNLPYHGSDYLGIKLSLETEFVNIGQHHVSEGHLFVSLVLQGP